MSPSAKELLEQALHLDEADRASLAGALIESLDGPPDEGVQDAWEDEIRRRVEAIDTGAVETIPWSTVRARLFSGYE